MNKRGQETREHIKRCACPLFAEKGFKQVTMKDVCEAAGVSRGGLYCHYESTRQIFQEIIGDLMSRQDDVFEQRIGRGEPAVRILDGILEEYRREMLDGRSSLSTAIYEYFSSPDLAGRRNALYEQYVRSANTWKKLLQYGIDRGEFRRVEIDAVFDLIVFSYQGVRMYSKLMPVDEKIPAGIIREIRKILVRSDCDGNDF